MTFDAWWHTNPLSQFEDGGLVGEVRRIAEAAWNASSSDTLSMSGLYGTSVDCELGDLIAALRVCGVEVVE